jgi:gas vesicle protein
MKKKFISALVGGKEGWIAVIVVVVVLLIAEKSGKYIRSKQSAYSPRNMKSDTIYSNDSIYILSRKIDTVYYAPQEYEPEDRRP